MAIHKVTLEKGITVGDVTHREVTLKELSAGDVMEAMDESERLLMVPTTTGELEAQLVLSNAALGINTLRKQIASLGEIEGPLEREQMALLSHTDLELLQAGAQELDAILAKAVIQRGRSDAASEGGREEDK